MPLHRQLWLALAALLLLGLLGGFTVSALSTQVTFKRELERRNKDQARTLALALSGPHQDETRLQLMISGQFDSGLYRRMVLTRADGKVLVERHAAAADAGTPAWLQSLIALNAPPGSAAVDGADGHIATLELEVQSSAAHAEFWAGIQRLALSLLAVLTMTGVLSVFALRIIAQPMRRVIDQSAALSEGRFITVPEAGSSELRTITRSLNTLSVRVRDTLHQEASRLASWQRQVHYDELTGLMGRGFFLEHLDAVLRRDANTGHGVLVLFRLPHLGSLNQAMGAEIADLLLRRCGSVLARMVAAAGSGWSAGRLNGTDFALLAPEAAQPVALGKQVQGLVQATTAELALSQPISVPFAAVGYTAGESRADVLTRADASLALASSDGGWSLRGGVTAAAGHGVAGFSTLDGWRTRIELAFTGNEFKLATFPCVRKDRSVMHREALVRLCTGQEVLKASSFLPWVQRLERTAELDRRVLDLALEYLASQGSVLAINVSGQTLANPDALASLIARIRESGEQAAGLWLEISEAVAFRSLDGMRQLSTGVRPLGCRIGIDRVGQQLSQLGKLHDVGIDYVKVDGALTGGIDDNAINAALMRTLCTMLHAVGIEVIADGISTAAEHVAAIALGLDGFAGPEISRQHPD